MSRTMNQRPGNFRPAGRTVASRTFINGRMNRDSVKRIALEAYQTGKRVAEKLHEREHVEDLNEYERGFADAMRMVDEDDARAASQPPPAIDLGGLGYSEYWAVYAAVLDDAVITRPAPDEPDYGWSDE